MCACFGGSIGRAGSAICQRHAGWHQGMDDGVCHICNVACESWLADRVIREVCGDVRHLVSGGLEVEWRFVSVVIDGVVDVAGVDVEDGVVSVHSPSRVLLKS